MEIREAIEEDAAEIRDLVVSLSDVCLCDKEERLPDWFLSTLALKEFEQRLKQDSYIHLICKLNEKIVGYLSVKDKHHIYHLFVSPQQQKKGIAKQLWQRAMEQCGASRYTVRSSLSAIPVYQSFGFIKSAPVEVKEGIQFQIMELIMKH